VLKLSLTFSTLCPDPYLSIYKYEFRLRGLDIFNVGGILWTYPCWILILCASCRGRWVIVTPILGFSAVFGQDSEPVSTRSQTRAPTTLRLTIFYRYGLKTFLLSPQIIPHERLCLEITAWFYPTNSSLPAIELRCIWTTWCFYKKMVLAFNSMNTVLINVGQAALSFPNLIVQLLQLATQNK
jgi:hypothetical protein